MISEETRKKMSVSHTGSRNGFFNKRHTEESKKKISASRKGIISPRKGVHLSDETKQKMSLSHLGKPHLNMRGKKLSEATKHKLSLAKLGSIAPNKGTHLTNEAKRNLSIKLKGRIPWNKGKHHSIQTKNKLRKIRLGKHHSIETRLEMSKNRRGRKGPNLGRQLTDEWKNNLRIYWQNLDENEKFSRLNQTRSYIQKVSKPQKELFELLKQIFKDATLEYPIKTLVTYRFADIGVPSLKIAFEYDGEHWHEKRKEQDRQRDRELAEVGWATFRINKGILKILSQQKIFTLLQHNSIMVDET